MPELLNLGVFYNSPVCRWHLDKFKTLDLDACIVYDDVHLYIRSTQRKNIAILHWPYPYTPEFGALVDRIYEFSTHIFILMSEVHQPTVEFIQNYDREKISYYIAGTLKNPPQHAKLYNLSLIHI